jgi:hypothetical protein
MTVRQERIVRDRRVRVGHVESLPYGVIRLSARTPQLPHPST